MKRSAYRADESLADKSSGSISKRICLEPNTNDSNSTVASRESFRGDDSNSNRNVSKAVNVSNVSNHKSNAVLIADATTTIVSTDLGPFVNKQSDRQTKPILRRDLSSLIRIRQGDLTAEQIDVIVVCSFSRTLRESVLKAGGDSMKNSFEAEYNKDPTAPVIAVAASGQLAAKTVYFLPWKPNDNVAKVHKSIGMFIENAMRKAASENYQSIAFPAIGCGGYGCSISLIAQSFIEEVCGQLAQYPMFVSLVIQPDRTDVYDEFHNQIKSIQPVLMPIGKGMVEVQMGDITEQKVDVIIGSTSSRILKRAIMNAAGGDVQMAYAKEYGNNPNSIIISIPPGQLPCKRIFFLKWQPDTNEAGLRQSIVDFVWNVIQNVISYKFTSIAFPAIGCGKHGCSVDIVVKTIVREIKNQLSIRNIPLIVKFVIQPEKQNIYDEFCKQVLSLQEAGFGTSVNHQLPSTWEQSTQNKLRVVVPSNTSEYTSIIVNFDQTMKGKYTAIIQIERIQNERWLLQYTAHSQEFQKRLNTDTEMRLYHGCPQPIADLIIGDCFNRSFAGVHGTSYGIGVYFSSNAAYSNNFAYPNSNGERCMFVARVLIGKTTQGNSSIRSRPVGFDSTTNGNHIFVTYHDAQAFAEYLITYK